MTGLTYTLLGDGPSDRLLEYPVRWALASFKVRVELGQWADLRHTKRPGGSLSDRARAALELYPAELLFVHRDSENCSFDNRIQEIRRAVEPLGSPHVPIVPVRMTEAWLLHDVEAIRRASGNPNGKVTLSLPSPNRVESVVDPKAELKAALLAASELTGRRRQRRSTEFPQMRARTAELISNFEPLSATPAFGAFLSELRSALVKLGRVARATGTRAPGG